MCTDDMNEHWLWRPVSRAHPPERTAAAAAIQSRHRSGPHGARPSQTAGSDNRQNHNVFSVMQHTSTDVPQ